VRSHPPSNLCAVSGIPIRPLGLRIEGRHRECHETSGHAFEFLGRQFASAETCKYSFNLTVVLLSHIFSFRVIFFHNRGRLFLNSGGRRRIAPPAWKIITLRATRPHQRASLASARCLLLLFGVFRPQSPHGVLIQRLPQLLRQCVTVHGVALSVSSWPAPYAVLHAMRPDRSELLPKNKPGHALIAALAIAVCADRISAQSQLSAPGDRGHSKNVGVPWRTDTVDTFKAGDPDTPVTGIAVTMMARLDVIERAAALPEISLNDLAASIKSKLQIRVLRVFGDPEMKLSKAAFLPGAAGSPAIFNSSNATTSKRCLSAKRRNGKGSSTWPMRYPSTAARRSSSLGHITSEQAGIKECAKGLKTFITGTPITFVTASEPFGSRNSVFLTGREGLCALRFQVFEENEKISAFARNFHGAVVKAISAYANLRSCGKL
jgi:hypothetical protein